MSIRKYIPNSITSINLLCGTVGTVLALNGHVQAAFLFMLGGALADFCDGLSARLLGAYSPMGKELDSLADQVTFGVLPSVMMWKVTTDACGFGSITAWCWLMVAVFSGLRLAKFNIDTRQSTSFIGLPTPACAMICGSAAYFLSFKGMAFAAGFVGSLWIIAVPALLCFLLVSEIPMFSMKIHKGESLGWRRAAFFGFGVAALIVVAVLGLNWSLAVFAAFIAYIVINLIDIVITHK